MCVNVPMRNSFEQKNRIFTGQPLTGSTIFLKSDVLKELMPFDEKYSLVEYWYLYVMFFKNNKKISILEEKALNYRVHDENMSLNNLGKLSELHTEVQLKYLLKDVVNSKKKVIFFREESEILGLKNILNQNFKNDINKFEIVDFNKINDFLEENKSILNFNEDNLIFLDGGGEYIVTYVKSLLREVMSLIKTFLCLEIKNMKFIFLNNLNY